MQESDPEQADGAAAAAPTPAMAPAPDCGVLLRQHFPALFTGPAKPVKLRIQADIQQRAPGVFTKQALSAFLRRYTGSHAYLVALTQARQRYDLDGAPAGEVSEEHRRAAQEELARRRAIVQQRRETEDTERRNRARLLQDYERTTLTPANFCALKGLAVEELESLLAQARAEAADARAASPRPADAQRRPGPRGPGPRRTPTR